jgi:hypothetical protein
LNDYRSNDADNTWWQVLAIVRGVAKSISSQAPPNVLDIVLQSAVHRAEERRS